MSDNTNLVPTDPVRRRRPSGRTLALGGAAAVAIALGGGAAAVAATSSTPSPSPSNGTANATTGTATAPTGGPRAGRLANHQPHLDGKVKSVSGTTILITDHDGFTRTIVTSSTTKYTDGLTKTPAVGTQIHADGKVDANGTSLDATTVGKAPTPPAGGPGRGGPGGRGHGPGMGSRPTGTPPTGTPPTGTPPTTAPSVSPSPSAS